MSGRGSLSSQRAAAGEASPVTRAMTSKRPFWIMRPSCHGNPRHPQESWARKEANSVRCHCIVFFDPGNPGPGHGGSHSFGANRLPVWPERGMAHLEIGDPPLRPFGQVLDVDLAHPVAFGAVREPLAVG